MPIVNTHTQNLHASRVAVKRPEAEQNVLFAFSNQK